MAIKSKTSTSAKTYALLALAAYPDAEKMVIPGWQRLPGRAGAGGFYGVAFKSEASGRVILSYRGTNDLSDARSDLRIGLSFPAIQFKEAVNLYNDTVAQHGKEVALTGHSLGGALAALVCAYSGASGVTFNAPGTKHLARSSPRTCRYHDVIHFRAKHDPVSAFSAGIGRDVFLDLGLPAIDCKLHLPIVMLGCVLGQGSAYALEQHSMAQMVRAIGGHRQADQSPWDWS